MFRLEFTIEGLPKTTNGNARRHWRALHNEAKTWKKHVLDAEKKTSWHTKASDDPPKALINPCPLDKAKLTLTRFSSSEPDWDGLVSSFKHVIDGLVEAGVIVDDKMSVIGQPQYFWVKCAPKKGRIKVEVESF